MQRSSEPHPVSHMSSNEEDMDDEGEEAAEAEGRGEGGSTTTAATTTTTGGNTKTFVMSRSGSVLEVSWGHRGVLSGGVLEARTL